MDSNRKYNTDRSIDVYDLDTRLLANKTHKNRIQTDVYHLDTRLKLLTHTAKHTKNKFGYSASQRYRPNAPKCCLDSNQSNGTTKSIQRQENTTPHTLSSKTSKPIKLSLNHHHHHRPKTRNLKRHFGDEEEVEKKERGKTQKKISKT